MDSDCGYLLQGPNTVSPVLFFIHLKAVVNSQTLHGDRLKFRWIVQDLVAGVFDCQQHNTEITLNVSGKCLPNGSI